ncbi:MAG: AMP-binding protein [Acidiferrobacterales bacterium]|jgi:acyl-[acyl-carrier-protein]-phospholipid O-acyltransferase/long-chain-fatty-acid--[acyl-carrier-protein] ligase|nr:AMP-binding protein [Acidiferrobacterales bacterium]
MLLHQQFIRIAKAHKNKLAFIDRSTGRRMTYGKSLIAALILSRKLKQYHDTYIGIMVPTSAGCALTILATLFAGKVPVMINYSTGAESNARFAQQRCGFRRIVTSRALLEKIGCQKVDGMVFIEDILETVTVVNKLTAASRAAMPTAMLMKSVYGGTEDDTVVILFTSGSEKMPKGVELSHRNIASNVTTAAEQFRLGSDDIMMSVLPLFHVFGQSINMWLPIVMGMSNVTYGNPLEFKNVARIIKEEQPTMLVGTPFFLAGYLKQSGEGDFSSLRLVVAGADKVPDWLRSAFSEQQGIQLLEGYGATETSPVISVNLPEENKPGSVGRPLPGVQVRIVGVDSGEEVPVGHEGKILVKGDLVMKGYFDDLEETLLHIEDGWYETGDMGLVDDDGYLWHKGRLKRFVKIGGEMVSLVLVESVLESLLPDGVECCVVEIPDARKGANLAVAVSASVDQKQMIAALTKQLPPVAVPRQFVELEELPKMGSGKVDFRSTTVMVQDILSNVDS